ncbi:MAG: hypothetical protein L0Y72_28060 [Gemmataceae bacterium]|nr:hypothetical protein [Gemmataceae bacterium]
MTILMGWGQRMRDDFDDEPEDEFCREPAYPSQVRTAGIVWIVFGGLILLNLAVLLVLLAAVPGQRDKGAAVAGGVCASVFLGLCGGAFIFVGVQNVNGTAADTLGNGIGSIIFGILNWGSAIAHAVAGLYLQTVVNFIGGGGLLAAGILALVARGDYLDWRRAQKIRRLSDDRYDDNDRPRRHRYDRDDYDD